MTREEAIKELKESLETLREYDIAHSSRLKQALEMAIKALENHDTFMKYAYSQGKQDALEQQPCEDAVSREAVMDCFKKWQPYMATRIFDFEKELSELPSVTPSRHVNCEIAEHDGNGCLGYSHYGDDFPIKECLHCPKYTSYEEE